VETSKEKDLEVYSLLLYGSRTDKARTEWPSLKRLGEKDKAKLLLIHKLNYIYSDEAGRVMSEKTIVNSIKEHINGLGNNWEFAYGRQVFSKTEFLQKLDKDKKFRVFVVNLVVNLSVDILTRKGEK